MFWPIIVSFRVNPVGQSVLYVMMRQPLLSLDGCNALPCQSGDTDTCSSCTAELRSGTIAVGMQACSLHSSLSNDLFFFLRISNIQTQYSMDVHSRPKGSFVCPWSSPRFLAPVVARTPLPSIFPTTGCTATQRLSAFPSLRSHSFSGWLRRSVHPRSLGDLGELRTLGHY